MRVQIPMWVMLMIGLGGVAGAQSAATTAPQPSKGYVEGFAQFAFGGQISQSYGGELGFKVTSHLDVFGEGGWIRNAASDAFGASAQLIAASLVKIQSGTVTFTANQPLVFGIGGVKYRIPTHSRLEPYVLGGFGFANVTQDVHFYIAGTDVTANLSQYGVVLGTDLAGELTKPMLSLGGGATWPVVERLVLDLQYRFGHVLMGEPGITVNRAGVGVGIRF